MPRRCWPIMPEQLQMGRPGAFGAALLILLAPFVPFKMGLDDVSRNTLQRLCSQARAPGQSPGHPMEVEGDLNHGPHQPIQPGEFQQRSPKAPRPSYTAGLLFTKWSHVKEETSVWA